MRANFRIFILQNIILYLFIYFLKVLKYSSYNNNNNIKHKFNRNDNIAHYSGERYTCDYHNNTV